MAGIVMATGNADFSHVKHLFLDAGGVILDESSHEKARAELTVAMLRERGLDYSIEDYWSDIEESLRVFALHTYGYVFWKRSKDPAAYRAWYGEYLEAWRSLRVPLVLMDGIEEALACLSSKYRIGILGQYGPELTELLESRGLLAYFAYAATQERFALTKPDPRYFEQVLALASAPPRESCMIGDRIDKDILPAMMIGMKTVRVRSGIYAVQEPRLYEELADAESISVAGLADIL